MQQVQRTVRESVLVYTIPFGCFPALLPFMESLADKLKQEDFILGCNAERQEMVKRWRAAVKTFLQGDIAQTKLDLTSHDDTTNKLLKPYIDIGAAMHPPTSISEEILEKLQLRHGTVKQDPDFQAWFGSQKSITYTELRRRMKEVQQKTKVWFDVDDAAADYFHAGLVPAPSVEDIGDLLDEMVGTRDGPFENVTQLLLWLGYPISSECDTTMSVKEAVMDLYRSLDKELTGLEKEAMDFRVINYIRDLELC